MSITSDTVNPQPDAPVETVEDEVSVLDFDTPADDEPVIEYDRESVASNIVAYREHFEDGPKQRTIIYDPDGLRRIPFHVNGISGSIRAGTAVDLPVILYNMFADNLAESREAENRRRRLVALGQVRDPRKMQTLAQVKAENKRK